MTICQADATGTLKALSGIQVAVYQRDTTTPVTIFRARSGATQGPATEAAATGGPNPFITGASGQIEFWAEGPAEIDVSISDTQAPTRIAPRSVGWNALSAAAGSLPTSVLALDASLGLGSMGADVARQMAQIGQVIDWWRPQPSVPVPSGWAICDGSQVPAGQHDFPGLATTIINLPDLRNTFILGADATKAQAAGATQGDTAANAPGIGGNGGSNAAKNFAHGHGVAGVDHTHVAADHLHDAGSCTPPTTDITLRFGQARRTGPMAGSTVAASHSPSRTTDTALSVTLGAVATSASAATREPAIALCIRVAPIAV